MAGSAPLTIAAVAVAVGLTLQPVVVWLMTTAAVIDTPSARSSHTVPTPRGGGLAVVCAAATALVVSDHGRVLALPLLLFALIGLVEDVRGTGVVTRLSLQLVCGIVAAATVLDAATRTSPATGADATAVIRVVIVLGAAVWLAGFTNAFNFMDGVNGISAAHAIVIGATYALLGMVYEVVALSAAGIALAAAAMTFLPWNAGRARIFLGDVGSYGLGGLIGTLAVLSLARGLPMEAAVGPLALYLADTGWTLARRVLRGQPWHRPHRTHVYQRLTDLGWTHARVTIVTGALSTVIVACAVTASASPPVARVALDLTAVAILVGYLAAPRVLATHHERPPRPAASSSTAGRT